MTPRHAAHLALNTLRTAMRIDGWNNVITGLGSALRDKTRATRYLKARPLTDDELDNLFHEHDLASRICEVVPEEMMRPGFDLTSEKGDTAKVLERWHELEAHARITEAMIWGRAYGGGGIFMGVDDGLGSESVPLQPERVKKLQFLTVFDRRDLSVQKHYDNPFAPNFGKPELYRVITPNSSATDAQLDIHESRLIIFGGARTSRRRKRHYGNGWDLSVLQRVYDVLQDFGMTWGSVAHLMSDVSQAVYKMKGLAEMVAAGQDDVIQARLETVELGRSVARAVLLDAEDEEFERKPTPLAGVPEIMQMFVLRFAAAARMPATLAFAQSPAGLNATGESDMRWWYDTIQADRQNMLLPRLKQLFRVLWAEQGGEPETWEIRFRPMREPTQKEAAEIRELQARTDKAYVDAQILLPEEIALSRFTEHGWSAETRIDREARERMLEASVENAIERAQNPPEPVDPNADPKDKPDTE